MKIELRIRNLKTREGGLASFETDAEALLWLKARPPMVEVMGLAGQGQIPHDVEMRLRGAMRPLDDEEQLAERELKLAADAEDLERAKAAHAKESAQAQKHKESMATADPERLMEVHWRFDRGMSLTDVHDTRTIPDAAKDAVLAWIAERNEWVAGRGQTIGECTVKVWPAAMPKGESERVKEGRFFPVSHEEKS